MGEAFVRMKLKNVLIVADDVETSVKFYRELFGLQVILNRDGNVVMTEGLVIQDRKVWENALGRKCIPENNMTELYFETMDLEAFAAKLVSSSYDVKIATGLSKTEDGGQMMRIYDPSGNLIEIREVARK